jgi:hypothetical protein
VKDNFAREKLVEIIERWDKTEPMVDYLLRCGVVVPPCMVGDAVYILFEDDDGWFIEKNKCNSVSDRGIWKSGMCPAEDDLCTLLEYDMIGETVFFQEEKAVKAREDKNNGKQQKTG